MTSTAESVSTTALQWYGLLGAPLAWTAQLLVGYGAEEAACAPAGMRWGLGTGPWQLAITVACGFVAVGGAVAATTLVRRVHRGGGDPFGRVGFMAAGGVLVSVVFLILIVLGGTSAIALPECAS
jgi:hypothetical protein